MHAEETTKEIIVYFLMSVHTIVTPNQALEPQLNNQDDNT
jgi:hypothetical protein